MGMFDYIKCEVPLPDGWTGELQSKDFDCEMVEHIISKDGRLMLERGHNEEVPRNERPYPDAKPGTLESICGIMRRVPKYEDANFHGMVNFYGTDGKGGWHEYNAKFTDGRLMSIEAVPDAE